MEHCGQFAILRRPVSLPGFRHIPLDGGWVLSCHERLGLSVSGNGRHCLIGDAWQIRPDRGAPAEELEKLGDDPDLETVLRTEESWCGRYVLVSGGRVIPDASGMLCVFCSEAGVSSDCLLLAREMGLEKRIHSCREVMNWMPAPMTQYAEISRLLPSQTYHYLTKTLSDKPLLASDVEKPANEEALIERFSELFCTGLRNMCAAFPRSKPLIALTGGYDSRTLFALALKAGIPFDAYTLDHDDMLLGDVELPKLLCERTNTRFHYIERDRSAFSDERERACREHTAGLVMDEDRLFYAYGQYQKLLEPYGDVLLLRSSIWENVIEYFQRMFDENAPKEAFYSGLDLTEDCLERRSIDAYFAWCAAHPQAGVNLANRFLWEQREGCWLSSIEQGFDLLDRARTLQPVNSRLLLTLLFRFPREERLTKRHQDRIIRAACPAIQDIPYAGNRMRGETLLVRAKNKLRKARQRLRKHGFRKTVMAYCSIFSHDLKQKRLEKRQEKDA